MAARTVRITGVDVVIAGLEKWKKIHTTKLVKGLKAAGVYLAYESAQIVPVDTGVLKASQFVDVTSAGAHAECTIGYTTDYAVRVHEDLELRHGQDYNDWYAEEIAAGLTKTGRVKKGWKGKTARGPLQQAKYLEQPFRQKRAEMVALIVAAFA